VFSGIITAKEGNRIGDKGSVKVQMLLETFLNMYLRSACSTDEGFLLVKKQNSLSWDYYLQMPNYWMLD
jgi:hypothetical protein